MVIDNKLLKLTNFELAENIYNNLNVNKNKNPLNYYGSPYYLSPEILKESN